MIGDRGGLKVGVGFRGNGPGPGAKVPEVQGPEPLWLPMPPAPR